eukprot:6214498-Pleurochrysis_carterae.AAC.6
MEPPPREIHVTADAVWDRARARVVSFLYVTALKCPRSFRVDEPAESKLILFTLCATFAHPKWCAEPSLAVDLAQTSHVYNSPVRRAVCHRCLLLELQVSQCRLKAFDCRHVLEQNFATFIWTETR